MMSNLTVSRLSQEVPVLGDSCWKPSPKVDRYQRGCRELMKEEGSDGWEWCLHSDWLKPKSVSLFIQKLVSRDIFMFFQNIDHITFVFAHVFHFLLLFFWSSLINYNRTELSSPIFLNQVLTSFDQISLLAFLLINSITKILRI